RISASAIPRSSRCDAQWSAVVPSPSVALTSTRCFSSARTAVMSLFLTAWMSGLSVDADTPNALTTKATIAATARLKASRSMERDGFSRADTSLQRQDPLIDPSRAVADLVLVHAKLIHQRQVQVGKGHVLEPHVPSALEMPGAAAGQDHRDV